MFLKPLLDIAINNVRIDEGEELLVASPETDLEPAFVPVRTINVVGVGFAGCKVAARYRASFDQRSALLVATRRVGPTKAAVLMLGDGLTASQGCMGSASLGFRLASEAAAELATAVRGFDITFVVAAMGGGTGGGAGRVVAGQAGKSNALVVGVAIMPFDFEGARVKAAGENLIHFANECDATIVFKNQSVFDRLPGKTPTQLREAADASIIDAIETLRGVCGGLHTNGASEEDVRSVFDGNSQALIAKGRHRIEEPLDVALRRIVASPFMSADLTGSSHSIVAISSASGAPAALARQIRHEMVGLTGNLRHNCAIFEQNDPALDEATVAIAIVAASVGGGRHADAGLAFERKTTFKKGVDTLNTSLAASVDNRLRWASQNVRIAEESLVAGSRLPAALTGPEATVKPVQTARVDKPNGAPAGRRL